MSCILSKLPERGAPSVKRQSTSGRTNFDTLPRRRLCGPRLLVNPLPSGTTLVPLPPRDTETRTTQSETTFNAAMTMDGGVGQSVW